MHRIDTPTAQQDKFGAGKNGFTGGNPQTGELATALDADFFDSVQEEIAGVIEAAGTALVKGDNTQLLSALRQILLFPVGVPVPWPTSTPPAGWIKCNGSSFSASDYPALAAVYTTLKLPDLRGEFIRGWDDGRGVDTSRGILTSQGATSLRTAALDYFSVDSTTSGATVGTSFAQADSAATTVPSDARGPNNTVFSSSGAMADNTITATQNGSGLTNGSVWITVRPRNIAFNYIVRAA